MGRIHLTPRLRTMAALVPDGAVLADIGTDHAILPVSLLMAGRISHAIASDLRSGPLDSARRTAQRFAVQERVSLRLGAGLETVAPFEADTVAIAGMGGETIAEILQAAPWTKQGSTLLLLQPMTMQARLRQWLLRSGYAILKETLCTEGHRIYTILSVRGGAQPEERPIWDCYVSEALLRESLAGLYLRKLLTRESKAMVALKHADRPEDLERVRRIVLRLEQALTQWEEIHDGQ